MRILQLSLLFICLLVFVFVSPAQQAAAIDSIKASYATAKTPAEKVYWLDHLSRTLMNVSPLEAEKFGNEMITVAEESRERELMVDAYMSNGLRCSYFGGQKDYTRRSIEFYTKALGIARQNKIENKVAAALLQLSVVHLMMLEKDKALSFINQAFSLISTLDNDSLKVEANNIYGRVYLAKNEKTMALRHYFNALAIAEEIRNNSKWINRKPGLLRNCYLYLSSFYSGIEDYDKAIDYATLAYKKLDDLKEKNVPYQRAIDINSIGNLFASKQNHDIAISYFERSIKIADSLKFSTLKTPGYVSLLNQYLRMDQPQKALAYLNSPAGRDLSTFLTKFGFTAQIDQAYAYVYTELDQFDSAGYYFAKALPFFESSSNDASRAGFYRQLGGFYKKSGDNSKAIEYFQKVKQIGENRGILDFVRFASNQLDTLYSRTGDYKTAGQYNAIYHQYKDSIEKLNKENELAQIEAQDEHQRQERILKEKEEAKEKRIRIQYMSIIIGIAVLFVALVMMGWFKVSANTIRAIGFFSFLIFFEFIFLVFKKNIYGLTHGEPLYDLVFMIALAALLVPLHHWLEHKVIHFLTSHHMLKLRRVFSKQTGEPEGVHLQKN